MHKKGQISLFIIIGIVILISLIIILIGYNSNLNFNFQNNNNLEKLSIESYIKTCIDSSLIDSIKFISKQGGYYITPNPKKRYSFSEIPVYWDTVNNHIPSIAKIENETLDYMMYKLPICLNNLTIFKEQGHDLVLGEMNGKVTITKEDVYIKLNYPITIRNNEAQIEINDFYSNIKSDFFKLYNYSNQILTHQAKIPNSLPVSFIAELADQENISVDISSYNDNIIMLILKANQINPNNNINDDLFYTLLLEYDWDFLKNRTKITNLDLKPIPPIIINETNQDTKYYANATGEEVRFYSNSNIINIDNTSGIITLKNYNLVNGETQSMIKAIDKYGNIDIEYLTIIIDYKKDLPIIEPINNLTIKTNEEFIYQVNATDPYEKYLVLMDNTDLFDIHPLTGIINFTPEFKGNYTIKITAINLNGPSFEDFNLEII
jgi:hypothetical protein